MPDAVLFDLDCTLTERPPSLVRYAQLFVSDFQQHLDAPTWQAAHSTIVAVDVLRELRQRGFRIGVVTNGRTAIQRPKIETLGIAPLLDCIVVSEEVGHHKPHAAPFARALQDLGCSSGWYIGDHPRNDIFGASAAGLTPVWLRGVHPWPADNPPPEHCIDALSELLSLIGLAGGGRDR